MTTYAMARLALIAVMTIALTTWEGVFKGEAAQGSGTGTISGTVLLEGAEARPLWGAAVTLRKAGGGPVSGGQRVTASTDQEGHFVFTKVGLGRYTLAAFRQGFAVGVYGALKFGSQGATIVLDSNRPIREDIKVFLSQGAEISGRVTDHEGRGLVGGSVVALMSRFVGGIARFVSVGTAKVGQDGSYRLVGLPPGALTIAVVFQLEDAPSRSADGGLLVPPGRLNRMSYRPVFFPGVVDPKAATAVRLGEHTQRSGVDLRFTPTALPRLAGKVTFPSGLGPQKLGVELTSSASSPVAALIGSSTESVRVSGTTFSVDGLPAGQYVVTARAASYEMAPRDNSSGMNVTLPTSYWAAASVDVGDDTVAVVNLQMQPAAGVVGRVSVDGLPQLKAGSSIRFVSLQNAEVTLTVPVDSTGGFSAWGLPSGALAVSIAGPSESPAMAVQISLDGKDVGIAPDIQTAGLHHLDIRATRQTAALFGRIVTPAANGDARYVAVFPVEPRWRFVQSGRLRWPTRVAEDSSFEFDGLPPGDYYLGVLRDYDENGSAIQWEQVRPYSIAVRLSGGQRLRQDVRMGE